MINPMRDLTRIVCWTRMQTEAGQDVQSIIARKELERRAGRGLFFWGVGNAPSRSIKNIADDGDDIDVVFSLMKSRPRVRDVAPSGVFVWQTYFDSCGVERPIPNHVLVTSRMESASGTKKVHFALMCRSDRELRLYDQGPFDPGAYRNMSEIGGAVGPSQVTALLVRTGSESQVSDYRVNLRARLNGSYWVKLGQPDALDNAALTALSAVSIDEIDADEWTKLVSKIRRIDSLTKQEQPYLF